MQKYVIIVAGGSGKRMGSATPKQFLLLAGKPLLMHTLEAFYHTDHKIEIILVLPEIHIQLWNKLCEEYDFSTPHQITNGGSQRFYSVKNGLQMVKKSGLVAVHDGARPLIDSNTIDLVFDEAGKSGAAIPVTRPAESLRFVENGKSEPVDRERVRMVQTPQVFTTEVLKEAYNTPFSSLFTDDASVVESCGHRISLTKGSSFNIKVTNPEDLALAETLLSIREHGKD